MADGGGVRHGIGVSPGVAIGPLVVMAPPPVPPADERPASDVHVAAAAIADAFERVAAGLEARAAAADDDAAEILAAGALMARDPALAAGVAGQLRGGLGPAHAVWAAVGEFCAMLESIGGYMAERVTDLRDVRDRVIARLLGQPEPGVPEFRVPSILAARDLAPAETATLTPATCLGIVTELGGPTSHTAILAAQLGIPAVVQVDGVTALAPGTIVAVDGGTGDVTVAPSEAERASLVSREERRQAALAAGGSGPGVTKDGHHVPLLANIGSVEDARLAASQAVEGVGLFRTEFLFLDRDDAPSVEEQTAIYTDVLLAFGTDRRVVVRTLDAGADKPLKFADLGAEPNPALGRRGLRLGMANTEVLDVQLAALAAAYQATKADLWVMAPMVATGAEAAWFAERVHAAGLPKAGVMIEVPAAAIRGRWVLGEVEFGSLGTNDLQQYTMAADRTQGELADLLNPWEPAVLDVIAMACAAGEALGKPVGVCGESGGDPLLALVLAGLGVTSLSMAVGKVPAVRTSLAAHTLEHCQRLAAAARAAASGAQARQVVLDLADPLVSELI